MSQVLVLVTLLEGSTGQVQVSVTLDGKEVAASIYETQGATSAIGRATAEIVGNVVRDAVEKVTDLRPETAGV